MQWQVLHSLLQDAAKKIPEDPTRNHPETLMTTKMRMKTRTTRRKIRRKTKTRKKIKTSYDDIFDLWITPVNERKGYKIKNGVKYIPNILCKINGVENDREAFKEKFKKLITENSFIATDKEILTYIRDSTRTGKISLSVLKKNVCIIGL